MRCPAAAQKVAMAPTRRHPVKRSRHSSESKRRCVSSHHISPPNLSLGSSQLRIAVCSRRMFPSWTCHAVLGCQAHPSQSSVSQRTPPHQDNKHLNRDETHHMKSAPPNLSLSHPEIRSGCLTIPSNGVEHCRASTAACTQLTSNCREQLRK